METSDKIRLVQLPVINHKLIEVGEGVTKRLSDLDIDNLIATNDTVKSLKELRADLNKELTAFEDQRKFIKKAILKPYEEFDSIYGTEVSAKYSVAIEKLKDKIAIVENKIKEEKKIVVLTFFNELCLVEKIDFIKFDDLGLEINLSTSEKAYKEKCNEYISKVLDDIALIKTNEFEAEIMVEYKLTRNASKAITTVQERKASEKAEKERIRVVENNRRIALLRSMGFVFMDMTNSYEYDHELYLSLSDIESLEKSAFANKVVSFEESIKVKKAALQPEVAPVIQKPIVLTAPKVETKEEILTASFEVSGTRSQLLALGQYMKSNQITYKNI